MTLGDCLLLRSVAGLLVKLARVPIKKIRNGFGLQSILSIYAFHKWKRAMKANSERCIAHCPYRRIDSPGL